MAIPPHRMLPVSFFGLDPHVLFGVKHPKTRVIFLAIVTSENIEFPLVKRRRVILDLRSLPDHGANKRLRCLGTLGGVLTVLRLRCAL